MNAVETPLEHRGRAFLDELTRGDAALPRADGFRFTENGADIGADRSALTRAQAFSGLQSYADAARGQVVTIGLAELDGSNHVFALRLRVDAERVSEAESLFSTDGKGHFADPDRLAHPDVLYLAPIPPERATSEERLLAIAASYWDALESGDGAAVPIAYRCDAFDNGKRITNNLSILLSPDATVHSVQSRIAGTRGARPKVRERRYPVIDRALGLVVSFVAADFHTDPNAPRPDNGTFYFAAVFKIADEEIRMLDEFRQILPLGSTSGWGSDEEQGR